MHGESVGEGLRTIALTRNATLKLVESTALLSGKLTGEQRSILERCDAEEWLAAQQYGEVWLIAQNWKIGGLDNRTYRDTLGVATMSPLGGQSIGVSRFLNSGYRCYYCAAPALAWAPDRLVYGLARGQWVGASVAVCGGCCQGAAHGELVAMRIPRLLRQLPIRRLLGKAATT